MRVNNETVGHNFIYGVTCEGSSCRVDDYNYITKFYSYSSLMAIKFKTEGLIIVSDRISSYSNTSHKHHNHLRRALNGVDEVLYLSDISQRNNNANDIKNYIDTNDLKDKISEYIELSIKQKKARVADYSSQIKTILTELELILKYGKIDKRSVAYKQYLDIINNVNLDELISNSEKEEKAKKQKQANKAYKRNLEKLQGFTGVSLSGYTKREINEYNFLVIKGDTLYTSGHVNVELKEAVTLYKMLINGKDINGLKIGYYTILKHDKKTVKIGCHTIALSELKRVLGGLI